MDQERPTVVLTGASRGIGHATVKRFSDEGWRIITCSRDEVPEACQRDPNWTKHITADLAQPARWRNSSPRPTPFWRKGP